MAAFRHGSLAAFTCLLAVLTLALIPGASAADTGSSCHKVSVDVSKRAVRDGEWVRVSGRTCKRSAGPKNVRIKLRVGNGWRQAGVAKTRQSGRFSKRVRVNLPGRRTSTHLRAIASAARSRAVRLSVRIEDKAAIAAAGVAAGAPKPGNPNCPLSQPGGDLAMTLDGCTVVASDTGSASPMDFWGRIDCGTWPNFNPNRHTVLPVGGDPAPTATGAPQGGDAYRRLTVIDGDDVSGERCELGLNDHLEGPTAVYREGQRRATYASLRLPSNFELDANTWQTVFQMKQAQPSDGGGGVPILFMGAYLDEWHIESANGEYWAFPAQRNVWTRFLFDVYYSQDPDKGRVQVSADLNGDGVFGVGERSPVIETNTLMTEVNGPNGASDGLTAGEPIPSHLRAGIYHNASIDCPPPVGCSTEVDNVQVLAP